MKYETIVLLFKLNLIKKKVFGYTLYICLVYLESQYRILPPRPDNQKRALSHCKAGRSPVSEYIGYIPRDLSRDNWQICRAKVNSFCTKQRTEITARQKATSSSRLWPFLNFKFGWKPNLRSPPLVLFSRRPGQDSLRISPDLRRGSMRHARSYFGIVLCIRFSPLAKGSN